jgi:hypothetical protein
VIRGMAYARILSTDILSMHIPHSRIARAFVEHFGVGEVATYEHPGTGKVFNEIVLEGILFDKPVNPQARRGYECKCTNSQQ